MTQLTELLGVSLNLIILLVGSLLVIAEAIIPGAQFIVIGVSLLATGVIGFAVPTIGSSIPLLLGVFIITSILTFLAYSKLNIYEGEGGVIETSDSDSLKGIEGVVVEPVTQSNGKVDLNKTGFATEFQARTEFDQTIEEGTKIVVVDGGGGNIVTVQEMADITQDEIDKELDRELETE